MKLPGSFYLAAALTAALLLAAGCATFSSRPSLRVGITPDYPPIITKQDGTIKGLEADFALLLANKLKRRLEFVELPWDQLVPNLLAGDIDLIMSGMSITDARKLRIDFCDPYMKTGLMALVRRGSIGEFGSKALLQKTDAAVGVQKGTTGDIFVRENCPNARVIQYAVPNDAALGLQDRRIDVFVHDAPAVLWLASKYEAELDAGPARLTDEVLAWGIRADSAALKDRVNGILSGWKADGTLRALLKRWMIVPD